MHSRLGQRIDRQQVVASEAKVSPEIKDDPKIHDQPDATVPSAELIALLEQSLRPVLIERS
jgi:hypothetical protein